MVKIPVTTEVEVPSLQEFNELAARVDGLAHPVSREEFDALVARVAALEGNTDPTNPTDPTDPTDPTGPTDPTDPPPPAPGVIWERLWNSQAIVDQDWYFNNMNIKAGEPGSAIYDPDLGGAKLIYSMKYGDGSLHPGDRAGYRVNAPREGIVSCEVEIYIPQEYYDLPWNTDRMTHNSQKWFRVHNMAKRPGSQMEGGCASNKCDDTVMTLTYVAGPHELWIRSLVQDSVPTGWCPNANEWTTIRLQFDYDNLLFKMFGAGQQVAEVPLRNDAGYPLGIDCLRATLHSTSRTNEDRPDGYYGDPTVPDTFIGYRAARIIVG